MIIIKSLHLRRLWSLLFILSLFPCLVTKASHMVMTSSYQYLDYHQPLVVTFPICTFGNLHRSHLHPHHLYPYLLSQIIRRTRLPTLLLHRPHLHLCVVSANHWTPSHARPHPCLYTFVAFMISTFRKWGASILVIFLPLPPLTLGRCKDLD